MRALAGVRTSLICWCCSARCPVRGGGQALDELMRKLLVVHRLLEAEERLATREPGSKPE
jgi:hypothetical protein